MAGSARYIDPAAYVWPGGFLRLELGFSLWGW